MVVENTKEKSNQLNNNEYNSFKNILLSLKQEKILLFL